MGQAANGSGDAPHALRNVVVAGGCGFVGAAFVRTLLDTLPGVRVTVLDPLDNPRRALRLQGLIPNDRLDLLRCPASNRDTVRNACRGVDALVSLGGWDPEASDPSRRPLETENLIRAAGEAGVGRFLHLSSARIYGPVPEGAEVDENRALCPEDPATAALAAADQIVRSYAHARGYPTLVVRAGRLHGPFDRPDAFVPSVVRSALRGWRVTLYGSAMARWDWLHVKDLCRALLTVLGRGRAGAVYNVGSGEAVPDLVLAQTIMALADAPDRSVSFRPDRRERSRGFELSTRRIRRELGWRPDLGHLEALSRTVSWIREHPRWEKTFRNPPTPEPPGPGDPWGLSRLRRLARDLLSYD